MKQIEKIFIAIEMLIYVVTFAIILYNMCNFKYVKVENWKAATLYGGVGIVLPLVGLVVVCVLHKNNKRLAGRIIEILLIPYFLFVCYCGFILMLGGVTCSATKDLKNYEQYDKEVVKELERYSDILPERDQEGVSLADYDYQYMRTLNDNFNIAVTAQYQEQSYLEAEIEKLKEEYGATVVKENEKENCYQYGDWKITCNMEQKQIVYKLEH